MTHITCGFFFGVRDEIRTHTTQRSLPPQSSVSTNSTTRTFWSEKRDSNPRPRPWQGRALPTELFSHWLFWFCGAKLCTFSETTKYFHRFFKKFHRVNFPIRSATELLLTPPHEVRGTYVLLWTAFLSEYRHQSQKKLKEFEAWKQGEGIDIKTPDELIAMIQESIKKARG